MLTEDIIQENKIKYLEILSGLNIDLTNLVFYLEKIDFFHQPLTSSQDKAYPGGLTENCINLYNAMTHIRNMYPSLQATISDTDIIIVSCFRGFYRGILYTETKKKQLNPSGVWEEVDGYKISQNRPLYGNISFASFRLASYFVSFTDPQALAIMYGGLNETNVNDIYDMMRGTPLLVLTQMAEMSLYLKNLETN